MTRHIRSSDLRVLTRKCCDPSPGRWCLLGRIAACLVSLCSPSYKCWMRCPLRISRQKFAARLDTDEGAARLLAFSGPKA